MPDMQAAAGDCAFLVWDAESPPPAAYAGRTLLWRSVAEQPSPDIVSVPLLVERNADLLRARYLAWVHDVGADEVAGRSLVERLELREGFSYWWMTPLSEKCNYSKSPQIDHAIRLLAYAHWVGNQEIKCLEVATADPDLAACLQGWCGTAGVTFVWRKLPAPPGMPSWIRRVGRLLPDALQAIVWLGKYAIGRWPLKGQGLRAWRQTAAKTTFASYSLNLRPEAARSGRFDSLYWGNLPATLAGEGRASNWMHLFVEDGVLPSAGVARKTFALFNKNEHSLRTHVSLDSFLGWNVVSRSLRDWLRFRRFGRRPPTALRSSSRTGIDLGLLFETEWRQTFLGREALQNFLYYNLVEAAVSALPKQDVGVYLQENQAWEMAFIHAWRAAGHGKLIGAPHSSVRYWDLRYFHDEREYARSGECCLPLPDLVAVNGPAAMRVLVGGRWPRERLVGVEALRYLYLLDLSAAATSPAIGAAPVPLRVLVLTDYDARHTRKQLDLLAKALDFLPGDVRMTFKAHPALPLSLADLPGPRATLADRPLPELLAMSDVAYASSVTSAAVDAHCAGLPVVAVFDPGSLNMSPLRGLDTVEFVHSPQQLAHALTRAPQQGDRRTCAENFFTLDKMLPCWSRLLAPAGKSSAVADAGN